MTVVAITNACSTTATHTSVIFEHWFLELCAKPLTTEDTEKHWKYKSLTIMYLMAPVNLCDLCG